MCSARMLCSSPSPFSLRVNGGLLVQGKIGVNGLIFETGGAWNWQEGGIILLPLPPIFEKKGEKKIAFPFFFFSLKRMFLSFLIHFWQRLFIHWKDFPPSCDLSISCLLNYSSLKDLKLNNEGISGGKYLKMYSP